MFVSPLSGSYSKVEDNALYFVIVKFIVDPPDLLTYVESRQR